MLTRDLLSDPLEAKRELEDLRGRRVNFSPPARHPSGGEGWRIDDHWEALVPEKPGEPEAGGSWEAARAILRDYDFVDPSIVRALYRSTDPLEGRDMLLELRVIGLRFHVGVRVGEVTDRTLTENGRPAAVWGWDYRTLEGHFEAGQMDYQVRKWLDTGEVEFRIDAFSRVAHIPNPVIRWGFRLLGRRKQTQFARRACERMRELTRAEVEGREPRPPAPEVGDGLVVRPAAAT